ncbi:MAG: hypothetical protein LBQ60_15755 [Bacteroidales bacterium]|jgi:hypothetical protein|nr:hypothetical protein [Bacteroidales bacterium]
MSKRLVHLDFEIDKLTHSIENTFSGDSFTTDILPLTRHDLKQVTKKNRWNFNWKEEFDNPSKDVYKLTIVQNPDIIDRYYKM